MPISRALLNRLRLPYKALDIQGSKGDVLYIPDDVGVDLSVMHGMYNGDMVPVKTDTDGVVSVVIDDSGDTGKPKHQYRIFKSLTANDAIQTIDFDTSRFLSYLFIAIIEATTDTSIQLELQVDLVVNNIDISGGPSASSVAVVDSFITLYALVSQQIVLGDTSRLIYLTDTSGQTCTFSLYAIGFN